MDWYLSVSTTKYDKLRRWCVITLTATYVGLCVYDFRILYDTPYIV